MVSDTAIVMIMAMVIVTFRQRPTSTSDRTYLKRIGCRFLSAVDAAGLVPHDLAALDLDDPAAHLVDDVGVVRDHHHGRPGAVDPVQQPHDLDGGVRVQVSGGLV